MNNSLNLSEVIECVKKIVDSVRCTVCDKAEGGRARFPCGHTTCDGCLTVSDCCMLCLTPPNSLSASAGDEPFTRRASNACNLLTICQETFNLDVYKTIRTSLQLKAERELFPKCIQAPLKYFNKRKSLTSKSNKENLNNLTYPGESISQSNSFKMNKSNFYVKQWLNNSEKKPRKAFADLMMKNQNHQSNQNGSDMVTNFNKSKMNQKASLNKDVTNLKGLKSRKRPHSNKSISLLDKSMQNDFRKSRPDKFHIFDDDLITKKVKYNVNDESGIVLDDEPILIEDSQSQLLDKDALALKAVEAADNEETDCSDVSPENIKSPKPLCEDLSTANQYNNNQHVPFYKKGPFIACKNIDSGCEIKNESNNISVTIENNSYITTINISTDSGIANTSVEVQTDISDIPVPNDNITSSLLHDPEIADISKQRQNSLSDVSEKELNIIEIQTEPVKEKRVVQSPNIFELNDDVFVKKKCIVIDDSDSDVSSSLEVSLLDVKADIHRSCEPCDYGILEQIDASESLKRKRNKVRGVTPDSNNSSDKENCDPNKRKKRKNMKKSKLLKK